MIRWMRQRRAAKREAWWRKLLNGHDFETTQYEANKPIIITCRRCGYEHMDVWSDMAPWAPSPRYPVQTPCPVSPPT
jgi:hypothetical protein